MASTLDRALQHLESTDRFERAGARCATRVYRVSQKRCAKRSEVPTVQTAAADEEAHEPTFVRSAA